MSCKEPGAITPEGLLAFADGDAPGHVADHVRNCSACAERVAAYASQGRALHVALLRFDCPTPQLLGDYEMDLLPAEERQRTAAHLVECPRCTDELRTLRSFLAAPEPAAVHLADRFRRIVAKLVTAPPGALAHAGLRGGPGVTLQTYRAETTTIALHTTAGARSSRVLLFGLAWREGMAPDVLAGSAVRLLGPDGTSHAEVDDLGNFAFDEVAPGVYQFELHLAEDVVVVADVHVDA